MTTAKEGRIARMLESIETDIFGVVHLEEIDLTELQTRARTLLSDARAVVILGQELMPEVIHHLNSRVLVGEMAMRDVYEPHTNLVNGRLNWQGYRLVKHLHESGYRGLPLAGGPFDGRFLEGAISYPALAQAAGLGYRGWHSMLITPEYGPRLRLGAVVTNALLPATHAELEASYCVKCGGACAKVCPSGAIKPPGAGEAYSIDKFACSTYIMAVGTCAECVKACPTGRRY